MVDRVIGIKVDGKQRPTLQFIFFQERSGNVNTISGSTWISMAWNTTVQRLFTIQFFLLCRSLKFLFLGLHQGVQALFPGYVLRDYSWLLLVEISQITYKAIILFVVLFLWSSTFFCIFLNCMEKMPAWLVSPSAFNLSHLCVTCIYYWRSNPDPSHLQGKLCSSATHHLFLIKRKPYKL